MPVSTGLLPRQRVELLLDRGSAFLELGALAKRLGAEARAKGFKDVTVRAMDSLAGGVDALAAVPLAAESADVVVSNCVVNLSPRKDLVLAEAARGGAAAAIVSDAAADRGTDQPADGTADDTAITATDGIADGDAGSGTDCGTENLVAAAARHCRGADRRGQQHRGGND